MEKQGDLVLRSGAAKLVLTPREGGAVRSLTWEGVPILRTAVEGPDVRSLAAFPLVPFSGRISEGRFRVNGEAVTLTPNMPPEPHAIHGQGWQRGWEVSLRDAARAELVLRHDPGNWPWAYEARQSFVLSEQGLTVTLSLTHLARTDSVDAPMPAGLGWHPYFPLAGAEVYADTTHVWAGPPGEPACDRVAVTGNYDLRPSRRAEGLGLDHAFAVASPVQTIRYPDRRITLRSSDLFGHLIVFTPPGEDYLCVEPVSHAPDAVNLEQGDEVTGLRWLAPGERLEGEITLAWEGL